jgi:hypothetical protein
MHKVVTTRDDRGGTRTARVFVTVTLHPRLRDAVERAVLAALDAYRGARDEKVVHVKDARNRLPETTPPPGWQPGKAGDGASDPGPGDDEQDDQEQSV